MLQKIFLIIKVLFYGKLPRKSNSINVNDIKKILECAQKNRCTFFSELSFSHFGLLTTFFLYFSQIPFFDISHYSHPLSTLFDHMHNIASPYLQDAGAVIAIG